MLGLGHTRISIHPLVGALTSSEQIAIAIADARSLGPAEPALARGTARCVALARGGTEGTLHSTILLIDIRPPPLWSRRGSSGRHALWTLDQHATVLRRLAAPHSGFFTRPVMAIVSLACNMPLSVHDLEAPKQLQMAQDRHGEASAICVATWKASSLGL